MFLSYEACAGDLAWHLKQEGHEIKWYVQSKADRGLYDGFIDKVDEWEPHKDWADLFIIDDIGFWRSGRPAAQRGQSGCRRQRLYG